MTEGGFSLPFSGPRSRVRVFSTRFRFGPAPAPEPEDLHQIPDQLRPETRGFAWVLGRDASAYASVLSPRSRHRRAPTSYPVPGLLLSSVSSCHPPPEIVPLPILNTPYSKLSYATIALSLWSTNPLGLGASSLYPPLSPCHRVNVPPRASARHRVNVPPLIIVSRVLRTLRLFPHHTPRTTSRSRA